MSANEPERLAMLIHQLEAGQRELAERKAALLSCGPQSMDLPPELRQMLQMQGYQVR